MGLENFLHTHGVKYTVFRDGNANLQQTETGLPNQESSTNRVYISFLPGADIKVGDLLVNPVGEKIYVSETSTDFHHGSPYQLKAFYQTELEKTKISQPVFNIQNAYGSVIGTGNNAVINYDASIQQLKEQIAESDSPDKEDMEKIISLLEMVINNQVPPSKDLFSKFSSVMSRHSWLSNSVSAAIFGWLMSKIP